MKKNGINRRIDELDYIRGFALLGIILVNILSLLMINIPSPNTVDASYQRFLFLFIEGRFFTIFSFLFGVGFYIFFTKAVDKGKNGYVLFLRRLVVLFIFGIIQSKYHPEEILTIYAICGLLVLPFYKVNKRINLIVSIMGIVACPFIGGKVLWTFPLMLLGLAAGQYRVFENISQKIKNVAIFTVMMFILSVVGLWYQYKYVPAEPFVGMILKFEGGTVDQAQSQANKFLSIGLGIGPIVSALYVGVILLLLQTKVFQVLLSPLKYYGRMALTNYQGQAAIILIIASMFTFSKNMTYMDTLYVCMAVCIIQMIFSAIWLKFFKMGPSEWIWRVVTYWTIPPFKKKSSTRD
ncbi:DUF418 domain-containing protein [Brevibacterium sp. JNUCC-42]|nr:DUF418 domain-containing protein [Brevibacterium sp. JNUCC-42]